MCQVTVSGVAYYVLVDQGTPAPESMTAYIVGRKNIKLGRNEWEKQKGLVCSTLSLFHTCFGVRLLMNDCPELVSL